MAFIANNKVSHLRSVWREFNANDFGSKLREPCILVKRANGYDGKFWYRENRHGNPFDIYNVAIAVNDNLFPDYGAVYGTLLHEMIHQYQIQILGNNGPHDAVFNSIARHLERKYGFNVR